MAYSPAYRALAMRADGLGVRVWDVNARRFLRDIAPKGDDVRACGLSADGRLLWMTSARRATPHVGPATRGHLREWAGTDHLVLSLFDLDGTLRWEKQLGRAWYALDHERYCEATFADGDALLVLVTGAAADGEHPVAEVLDVRDATRRVLLPIAVMPSRTKPLAITWAPHSGRLLGVWEHAWRKDVPTAAEIVAWDPKTGQVLGSVTLPAPSLSGAFLYGSGKDERLCVAPTFPGRVLIDPTDLSVVDVSELTWLRGFGSTPERMVRLFPDRWHVITAAGTNGVEVEAGWSSSAIDVAGRRGWYAGWVDEQATEVVLGEAQARAAAASVPPAPACDDRPWPAELPAGATARLGSLHLRHAKGVGWIGWSRAEGTLFSLGTNDDRIRVWDVDGRRFLRDMPLRGRPIQIELSEGGEWLWFTYRTGDDLVLSVVERDGTPRWERVVGAAASKHEQPRRKVAAAEGLVAIHSGARERLGVVTHAILVLDLRDGSLLRELPVAGEPAWLAWHGHRLLVATGNRVNPDKPYDTTLDRVDVSAWDVDTGAVAATGSFPATGSWHTRGALYVDVQWNPRRWVALDPDTLAATAAPELDGAVDLLDAGRVVVRDEPGTGFEFSVPHWVTGRALDPTTGRAWLSSHRWVRVEERRLGQAWPGGGDPFEKLEATWVGDLLLAWESTMDSVRLWLWRADGTLLGEWQPDHPVAPIDIRISCSADGSRLLLVESAAKPPRCTIVDRTTGARIDVPFPETQGEHKPFEILGHDAQLTCWWVTQFNHGGGPTLSRLDEDGKVTKVGSLPRADYARLWDWGEHRLFGHRLFDREWKEVRDLGEGVRMPAGPDTLVSLRGKDDRYGAEQDVRVYSATTGKIEQALDYPGPDRGGEHYHARIRGWHGGLLVNDDGWLVGWRPEEGEVFRVQAHLRDFEVLTNGRQLVTLGAEGTLVWWDAERLWREGPGVRGG